MAKHAATAPEPAAEPTPEDHRAPADERPVVDERAVADERAPVDERGTLVVKDRVVDAIASRAVTRTPGVVAVSGGLAMVGPGRLPRISCVTAGDRVRVDTAIAVQWARSLTEVAAAVQQSVADDLQRLAGLRAETVTVTIDRIVVPEGGPS